VEEFEKTPSDTNFQVLCLGKMEFKMSREGVGNKKTNPIRGYQSV